MRSFCETASNSSIKSDRDVRSTVASNNKKINSDFNQIVFSGCTYRGEDEKEIHHHYKLPSQLVFSRDWILSQNAVAGYT